MGSSLDPEPPQAEADRDPADLSDPENLSGRDIGVLLVSVLFVALCGIAYELIIAAVSTYLVGNSVYQFSLTIGLFMFAMGVGSFFSKLITRGLLRTFIVVEIVLSVAGGLCSMALFLAYSNLTGAYTAVLYLTILLIGALVGLEIPILARILARRASVRDSFAHVLSLDYIGALFGSLLLPLFLIPSLGLIRSAFAIGLLNALVALLSVLIFYRRLSRPHTMLGAAVCAILFLVAALVVGTRLTSYAEQQLYVDQVILQRDTPYQRIVATQSSTTGEHRLYIDGHLQFSERDEYRYHEALACPVMELEGPRKRVLILGGGDGLAAREVLRYPEVEQIDLVDIDPAITEVCSEFQPFVRLNGGSLTNSKVQLHHEDAFLFVRRAGMLYDRVIIDLPDPHNEALNKLYSREFYRLLERRLAPGGYVVTQSSSPFATRRTYWCIGATLEDAGFSTLSYQVAVPTFGVWGFHIAGRSGPIEPPAIQQAHRYLTDAVFRAGLVFARDIERLDVPVNTFLEPALYALYNKEIRR